MIEFLIGFCIGVSSFAVGVLIYIQYKFKKIKNQIGEILQ